MNISKKRSIIYESIMGMLALVAVIFAIIDFTSTLTSQFQLYDRIITYIFITDYLVRLILSNNKRTFIHSNLLDLIAILPFNSILKVFRIAKITKLLRLTKLIKLTKLTRAVTYILRLKKKCKSFLDTNGFKYMLFLAVTMVFFGALGIHYAENIPFEHSIWWAFVTVTTVGYGDISPETTLGRIIASILMIIGIGLIGSLTSTITSYFFNSEKQKTTYRDEIIADIKAKLDDLDSLSDEDIDTIAAVLSSLRNTNQ